MEYNLNEALNILQRTPVVLETLLSGLPDKWITVNEGGEIRSAFDVVGHLLHGEQSDWIERCEIILSDKEEKKFKPFDRFAQFRDSKGKTLEQLLGEFKMARNKNLDIIRGKNLSEKDWNKKGEHPVFGTVTLKNLLATWVVHDLNHLSQISRVMAKQYKEETGPWVEYLRILK